MKPPTNPHITGLLDRADALMRAHRHQEAVQLLDQVLAREPGNTNALLRRGYAYGGLDDHAAALADFDQVLRREPRRRDAITARALALRHLYRLDEAQAVVDQLLSQNPFDAEAAAMRASILLERGRLPEALTQTDELFRLGLARPNAFVTRAAALWGLGRRDDAIATFRDALRLNPDFPLLHSEMAKCLLATGNLAEGWREFEYRPEAQHPEIEKRAPRWAGEPLSGKTILVFAEQGVGDTIQFARFLPRLAESGATVKALVRPVLLRLARTLPAPVDWFDRLDDVGTFDFQIPLLSLPHVFETGIDSIPADVPYLEADAEKAAAWRAQIGDEGYRIGIAWQGNPAYRPDHRRSVPLRHFAPLAALPGVRLISLQAVHGLDQLATLPDGMAVEELGETVTANPQGISEIAAAMAALDLVVTSDTAVAHLAGALGKTVWVALGNDPDWRWLADRPDSPWYPTMRLFRQKSQGDWDGVFAEIAGALAVPADRPG